MFLPSKGEFGKRAKWDNTYKVPVPIRCHRLKVCLGKMKIGLSTVTSGSFFFLNICVCEIGGMR